MMFGRIVSVMTMSFMTKDSFPEFNHAQDNASRRTVKLQPPRLQPAVCPGCTRELLFTDGSRVRDQFGSIPHRCYCLHRTTASRESGRFVRARNREIWDRCAGMGMADWPRRAALAARR